VTPAGPVAWSLVKPTDQLLPPRLALLLKKLSASQALAGLTDTGSDDAAVLRMLMSPRAH
jgi:hypothetical protein